MLFGADFQPESISVCSVALALTNENLRICPRDVEFVQFCCQLVTSPNSVNIGLILMRYVSFRRAKKVREIHCHSSKVEAHFE